MRRVLHVIDSLHLGGAQEVILNIVAGSTRYSHEVATLHGEGIYWDRLKLLKVPVHSLSPHKAVPIYVPNLIRLLWSGRFDILHCHLIASNLIAKPIGAALRVPVIINHDHTNAPDRASNRSLLTAEKIANRFATHVIAVSQSCRTFLIEHERLAPSDVTLIWNAIDTARFEPGEGSRSAARSSLGIAEDDFLIIGVGRLNAQKNFLRFLDVIGELRRARPHVRAFIAGNGPEESALRQRIESGGLRDVVRLLGYTADPRPLYLAADALLMPSRFEGLPMTLLEAMAMRVPVVASRLDGMAEVVSHGTDGFLCASDSDFVAALRGLADEPGLRDRIGAAARSKILGHFTAARMVREIEDIYDRFLQ
ncbi:MAG: glycosyltransferase [Terrimicrobiaceae bacterium]|nr:glycosyltransferase [Terrimicrobiaceae bacterium]